MVGLYASVVRTRDWASRHGVPRAARHGDGEVLEEARGDDGQVRKDE